MKAILFSFFLALFAVPMMNANSAPCDDKPTTLIVTEIDEFTIIYQEFDDGFDCVILLDGDGEYLGSHGEDC